MINNVVLNGRLTRDPELRYTASGIAVATFTVAVDRSYRNANGERDTDFINCVIWRKAAENFANFTHKGSLVGIQGRLQTRTYENQQGNRVYVTEVACENFDLLEPRSAGQNQQRQGSSAPQSANYGGNAGQTNFGQGNFGGNAGNGGNQFGTAPQTNANPSRPAAPTNAASSQNSQAAMGTPNLNDAKGTEISDDELPF